MYREVQMEWSSCSCLLFTTLALVCFVGHVTEHLVETCGVDTVRAPILQSLHAIILDDLRFVHLLDKCELLHKWKCQCPTDERPPIDLQCFSYVFILRRFRLS